MEANAALRGARVVLDDRVILRDVDLDIAPGIALVRGANGAGKTTLLRAIAGLVPLARGTRSVSGSLLALGHRTGLLRGLSARENLAFFARFRGRDASAVAAALDRWGLGGAIADRPIEALSAGQRRRAALARLDSEPADVVLLDEPFAELDDAAGALLHGAIARLGERGSAVVIASHAHPELDAVSRVIRIADGRLS
jgi:heme exporter protein A